MPGPDCRATVAIATVGRFHHFDMARELATRGRDVHLFTSYPKLRVTGTGTAHVRTLPALLPLQVALQRVGLERAARSINILNHQWLDGRVAREMDRFSVVIANHGNGLRIHKAGRRAGRPTLADCGMAHVSFVRDTLRDEFERWGLPYADLERLDEAERREEYEAASLILVPSRFVEQTFVEHGVPAGKIRVVPYGVDVEHYAPAPEPARAFRVFCVGYLGLRKGLPYLLEACRDLPREIEVHLVGGFTPDGQRLLGRWPGDRGRLRIHGAVPRTALADLLATGSLFVLPSLIEGLSLTLVQAMACGLPILATPNTGCEELIEDGVQGRIVPARDAQALNAVIREAFADRDRYAEMGLAGRARVASLGGWGAYGDGIEQALAAAGVRADAGAHA